MQLKSYLPGSTTDKETADEGLSKTEEEATQTDEETEEEPTQRSKKEESWCFEVGLFIYGF